MKSLIDSEMLKVICSILVFVFKSIYAAVIYNKCNCENKKTRNIICVLSLPFPIITGIICITKYKKSFKDTITIIITFFFSIASIIVINSLYTNKSSVKYYDKNGNSSFYKYEVSFTDKEGNTYAFDFDKSGYEYFYINSTNERFYSDWCYLDSDGYFYYDDDMSITAKNEICSVDEDGTVYYPAKFATFNKDGTIKYSFNKGNFSYDRLGKAYTYDYVPYYDADGNKYFYSFDSDSLKGSYTNVVNGEVYENEYSFVDENGYLVCDKSHSFVEQKDIENVKAYKDLNGEIYYWASGISWNEKGQLLDSYGGIIK